MIKIPILIVTCFIQIVLASPFSNMNARSMGMGGVGVASSNSGNAAELNPALLSHADSSKRFSMIFPSFRGQVIADPLSIKAFQDLQDANTLEQISSLFQSIPQASHNKLISLTDKATNSLTVFNNNLLKLSHKSLTMNALVNLSISAPDPYFAIGFYSSMQVNVEASPQISRCDIAVFNGYIKLMNRITREKKLSPDSFSVDIQCKEQNNRIDLLKQDAYGNLAILKPAAARTENNRPLLQSSAEVAAILVIENGIALSKRFDYEHLSFSFGLTPKYIQAISIYTNPDIHDIDTGAFDIRDAWSKYRKSESGPGLDAGMILTLRNYPRFSLGFVIKNLVPKTFTSGIFTQTDGDQAHASFTLGTQMRAGIAVKLPWGFSIASDVDITQNKPWFKGLKSQYVAAGAELDFFNFLRFRSGFRINLLDDQDQAISVGLGLNLIALHFDIAGHLGDNNIGIAAQLGIEF